MPPFDYPPLVLPPSLSPATAAAAPTTTPQGEATLSSPYAKAHRFQPVNDSSPSHPLFWPHPTASKFPPKCSRSPTNRVNGRGHWEGGVFLIPRSFSYSPLDLTALLLLSSCSVLYLILSELQRAQKHSSVQRCAAFFFLSSFTFTFLFVVTSISRRTRQKRRSAKGSCGI